LQLSYNLYFFIILFFTPCNTSKTISCCVEEMSNPFFMAIAVMSNDLFATFNDVSKVFSAVFKAQLFAFVTKPSIVLVAFSIIVLDVLWVVMT
ncbi:MAG: hypothetical protein ACFB0A_14680, partial [Croceivirga sp.]